MSSRLTTHGLGASVVNLLLRGLAASGITDPGIIDIVGSYQPTVALTGSYEPIMQLTGAYVPSIAITGDVE